MTTQAINPVRRISCGIGGEAVGRVEASGYFAQHAFQVITADLAVNCEEV